MRTCLDVFAKPMRSLARSFLIDTGQFLRRMDFFALISSIIAVLGLVLPLIQPDQVRAFFDLPTGADLVIYIFKMIGLSIALLLILQIVGWLMIIWGRVIKINVDLLEYLQDTTTKHASLKVVNNERDELTECYAMLVSLDHQYQDTILPIVEVVNPNHLPMSWGGGSQSPTITIPGYGGIRVLNIAKVTQGINFIFLGYDWEERPQPGNATYHVVVKLDGRLNGEPFRSIVYDGYLHSKNYFENPEIIRSFKADDKGKPTPDRVVEGPPVVETSWGFLPHNKQ